MHATYLPLLPALALFGTPPNTLDTAFIIYSQQPPCMDHASCLVSHPLGLYYPTTCVLSCVFNTTTTTWTLTYCIYLPFGFTTYRTFGLLPTCSSCILLPCTAHVCLPAGWMLPPHTRLVALTCLQHLLLPCPSCTSQFHLVGLVI